MLLMKTTALL